MEAKALNDKVFFLGAGLHPSLSVPFSLPPPGKKNTVYVVPGSSGEQPVPSRNGGRAHRVPRLGAPFAQLGREGVKQPR
ncbi:hypothetical protein PYJP_01980 [Pyrofollis japonicus]|nr:hypothetical protein PYJP_01980 [Pyrofollis japonicus]